MKRIIDDVEKLWPFLTVQEIGEIWDYLSPRKRRALTAIWHYEKSGKSIHARYARQLWAEIIGSGQSKSYQKGYRFEHRVKKHLEEEGYEVLRSYKSLGMVDLVALRQDEILLIQCKAQGALKQWQKRDLLSFAKIPIKPVIAYRELPSRRLAFKLLKENT